VASYEWYKTAMASATPAQLTQWYDAHAPALVLYARQLAPPGEAEDIVHDAFVRLMAQRAAPAGAKAWLHRAVRNAAISRLRSRTRRRARERRVAAGRTELFERREEDLLDARAAEGALASLPAEQREVIVLRIWAGLTLQQTADTMGRSVPAVFRLYRASLAAIRKGMRNPCETKTP